MNKNLIFLLSLLVGFLAGISFIAYEKLKDIDNYNKKISKENRNILGNNKERRGIKEKDFKTIIIKNNNYYKSIYSKEKQKLLLKQCNNPFSGNYSLLVVGPTIEHYKYIYLREILNKYKKKLDYKTLRYVYTEIGKFGYQLPVSSKTKEYNTYKFVKYTILVKNSNNVFKFTRLGVPIISGIGYKKYLKYYKDYDIKNITNIIKKIKVGDSIIFINSQLSKEVDSQLKDSEFINIEDIKGFYRKITVNSAFITIKKVIFTSKIEENIKICNSIDKEKEYKDIYIDKIKRILINEKYNIKNGK